MKVEEVGKLLQGTFLNETNRSKEIGAIAIDSRTMRKNDVFLCLLGKTLDGHNFVKDALLKKPSLIIVSKKVSIKTKVPILLVEDILDSGITLAYLKNILVDRNAASIKVCAFLDKPANRQADISADYVGKVIPDEFVIGYGLDYNEKYRNLPYVGVLSPSVYAGKQGKEQP